MRMDQVVNNILSNHFPNPPSNQAELLAFERRVGCRMDEDLHAFYLACNGASLFQPLNSNYRLLSLTEIVRARIAVFGHDDDTWGPASWYVVCSCGDGDFVAIDVHTRRNGKFPLFDVDHGTFPRPEYNLEIATCYSDFLSMALQSHNRSYWLRGE